ncbi:peptidoglycan-binding domain-containing protein [Cellulomonas sp. S1-8]|uniref:peptidoglycan-binding domain-containing protein n=1 Tax=Cellulomonas sp. S1-8 TaxID=2904790 RepID=UPI002242EA9D|nr:peptidoglycan-binding protein [Cellulomonas sp. S1-8]UZN04081.1 biotin/lipoyl-binding protein [Cellulomonas sp. S1-8]
MVALRPSEATPVRSAASGMVTQVNVVEGDAVSTGTVLVAVGDEDVVAYTSARPMHTDVAEGDSGAAVSVAQQVLTELGLYSGNVDGKAHAGTVRAIVAFNEAHGRSRERVLAISSLAWLGPEPVTAKDVLVRPGETVGPGTDLFGTADTFSAVDVRSEGGSWPDGPLVLDVGGLSVPLDPGSRAVTDSVFVDEVARILGPDGAQKGGSGVVRRAEPVEVGVVPASAVVTDASGRVCIFEDRAGAAVAITPTGGSLGTVDVDATLVGRPLLVNPREVRADLDCG